MKILLLNIVLLLFCYSVNAQQLYVCKTHTNDGKPIQAQIDWTIKPWGEDLEILLDNEGEYINGNHIYLFIDREVDGKFEPFDSKAIKLESEKTWTVFEYKFIELGRYKTYYINTDQDTLASEIININLENDFTSQAKKLNDLYYDRLKIIFCERVIDGRVINKKRYISMSKDKGKTHVYIINDSPLNSTKLLVDIWKKENSKFDYDKFVESKKFEMDPTWPDVFFRYKFKEPGEYKIAIYNSNEVLIKSGYIRVVN